MNWLFSQFRDFWMSKAASRNFPIVHPLQTNNTLFELSLYSKARMIILFPSNQLMNMDVLCNNSLEILTIGISNSYISKQKEISIITNHHSTSSCYKDVLKIDSKQWNSKDHFLDYKSDIHISILQLIYSISKFRKFS